MNSIDTMDEENKNSKMNMERYDRYQFEIKDFLYFHQQIIYLR